MLLWVLIRENRCAKCELLQSSWFWPHSIISKEYMNTLFDHAMRAISLKTLRGNDDRQSNWKHFFCLRFKKSITMHNFALCIQLTSCEKENTRPRLPINILSLTALMIEQQVFCVLSFAECWSLQIHCLRGRRNLAKDNNLAQKHLVGMQLKPVGCIHTSDYSPDPPSSPG